MKKHCFESVDTGRDIHTPTKQPLRMYARGWWLQLNLQQLCSAMQQDPQTLLDVHPTGGLGPVSSINGMVSFKGLANLIWSHDLLDKLKWAEKVSHGYQAVYSRLRIHALNLYARQSAGAKAEYELYCSFKPDTLVNAILKNTHPRYTPGIYPRADKAINTWMEAPSVMEWYLDACIAAANSGHHDYREFPELCWHLPEEKPPVRYFKVSASEQEAILAARKNKVAA